VPLSCVPNVRLVGDSVTAGAAPYALVPPNSTIRLNTKKKGRSETVRWGRNDIQKEIKGMPRIQICQLLREAENRGERGKIDLVSHRYGDLRSTTFIATADRE
jgi:hypothetical protein